MVRRTPDRGDNGMPGLRNNGNGTGPTLHLNLSLSFQDGKIFRH